MTRDLEDLIRYENEGSTLDFKAVQYTREMYPALIKDVLAMANADVEGDRLIICGVKLHQDGSRTILGIEGGRLVDSATYQQVIRENIEPDVTISYEPFAIDGVVVGILRIVECGDPPYMLRKDFRGLRRGEMWIRKGSHQTPMLRRDLDRIFSGKLSIRRFAGTLHISFAESGQSAEIRLPAVGQIELPSDRAERRIRAILSERKALEQSGSNFGYRVLDNIGFGAIFGGTPYEQRSTDQLEQDLESIAETYRDHDLYTVYELNAQKLNFEIVNSGEEYAEDALFRTIIPKVEGLLVATEVHLEPQSIYPLSGGAVVFPFWKTQGYPTVTEFPDHYCVQVHVGDLKHGLTTVAFDNPLRVVLGPGLAGSEHAIRCEIHARNLPSPHVQELRLIVEEPNIEA